MATNILLDLPSPRSRSFAASSRDTLYLWGGDGDTEPESVLLFDVKSEAWTKKITKGPHPPAGLCGGGCALAGRHLFLYGGWCELSLSGTLYQINIDDWIWRELSKCAAGGPGKKVGCRMIVYKDQLLLLGGFCGKKLVSRQAGANYEDGYTNELHCYSLTTGSWSSPSVKGSRPPPYDDFSLTMIDEEHAVMFGGYNPLSGRSADVHILHLPTMSWTRLPYEHGDRRPAGRDHHIAVCLGYGGQHKRVLVSGGEGDTIGETLGDILWLLDPQSGIWKKVQLLNTNSLKRYCHSAASFTINSECVEVVLFGGQQELEGSNIADTVAMKFELQDAPFSSTKSWILTDIADHTQLGSPRRLEEKRRIMESFSTPDSRSVDERVRRLQQQLEEMETRAREAGNRATNLERRVAESDRRAEESTRRAEESDRRAEESDRRAEESGGVVVQLRQELAGVTQSFQLAREQQMELELQLQESTRQVLQARQQLRECEQRLAASNSHWVVRRDEIEMTGPELGRGGWATVSVATFRGIRVAAKTIHRRIISPHNIQLFRREMTMAARLRHPNLVQFIGATIEGNMVILTELMPTSLRAQLESDTYLQPKFVKSISLDVARALNYLHQMQPDPIIHRDLSSANVLMEPLSGMQWRAKLSDYGTVNLVCQLETVNPGSPVYAAPEANNPDHQSPKMDIYSFGALMLEMLTGQLPTREDRPALLLRVFHEQLLDLIQQCLSGGIQDRPDAATIVRELS